MEETVAFCRLLRESYELIEHMKSESFAEEIERKKQCYEAMGRADPALFAQLWAVGCGRDDPEALGLKPVTDPELLKQLEKSD